jgi:hypothetical protein
VLTDNAAICRGAKLIFKWREKLATLVFLHKPPNILIVFLARKRGKSTDTDNERWDGTAYYLNLNRNGKWEMGNKGNLTTAMIAP